MYTYRGIYIDSRREGWKNEHERDAALALIWGLCVPVYGLSTCMQGRRARVQAGKRFPRQLSLDGNQRRARAARLAPSMQDNNTTIATREPWISQNCCKLSPPASDPSATSVRVSQMLLRMFDNRLLGIRLRDGGVIVGDLEFIGVAFKLIFYA